MRNTNHTNLRNSILIAVVAIMLLSMVGPFMGITAMAEESAADVTGVITSGETDEPLEDVTVFIGESQEDNIETQTNEDGEFTFENVEDGEYMLHTGDQNHHTKTIEGISHSSDDRAHIEIELTPLNIEFTPDATTTRHVEPGETITIEGIVENNGEETYEREIFVFEDGEEDSIGAEVVTVEPEDESPGIFTVEIETDEEDSGEEEYHISGPGFDTKPILVLIDDGPVISGEILDMDGIGGEDPDSAYIEPYEAWSYIDIGEKEPITSHVDATSQYAIPVPESGEYTVHADGNDYTPVTESVEVGEDGTTHVVALSPESEATSSIIHSSIEHIDGTKPSELPELNVFGDEMIQISLEDPEAGENIQELSALGVDETTTFRIHLEIEDYWPVSMVGTGDVTSWDRSQSNGNAIITIDVSPKSAQYIVGEEATFEDWPEGEDDRADIEFDQMITLALADDDLVGEGADEIDGVVISTDAQLFTYPMYFPPDNGDAGEFVVEVGGPHLTVDGEQNDGFYDAFLPDSLLESWNVDDPESELVASYQGESTAMDVIDVAGGVIVSLDLHYSVGEVAVSAESEDEEPEEDDEAGVVEVTDVDVPYDVVDAGDEIYINTEITNTFESPQEIELTLFENGEEVDSYSPTVPADDVVDDNLPYTPTSVGEFTIAVNGVEGGEITVTDKPEIQHKEITAPTPIDETAHVNDDITVEVEAFSYTDIEEVNVWLISTQTTFAMGTSATQVADDTWEATLSADQSGFVDDGEYEVNVTVINEVRNRVTETMSDVVNIDREAPKLSAVISAAEGNMAEGNDASVTIRSTEALESEPTATLENPSGDEIPVTVTEQNDREWKGTFTVEESGTYEVDIVGTDLAGNEGEVTATSQIITELSVPEDEPAVVENEETGTTVEFDTSEAVDNAYVSLTENDHEFEEVGVEHVGYGSLSGDIDPTLAEKLDSVTIKIPVDEEDVTADPESVEIHRYDDESGEWESFDTTYVENGEDGPYWVATVPGFSTYAPLASDTVPPQITDVTPDSGEVFDADTETVTTVFEYEDALSGIDVSSITVIGNGQDITAEDEVSITSEQTVIEVAATEGETFHLEVEVADHAGNVNTAETSFEIEEAEEEPDDTGTTPSGGASGATGTTTDDSDTEPTITVDIEDATQATATIENTEAESVVTVSPDDDVASLVETQRVGITELTLTPSESVSTDLSVMAFDPEDFENADDIDLPSVEDTIADSTGISYLSVDHDLDANDFQAASFTFVVDSETLAAIDAEPADVTVFRGENGDWVEYEPEIVSESVDETTYTVELPGFSTFAIATKEHEDEVTDIEIIDVSVDEAQIEAGEQVEILTTLENQQDASGEIELTIRVDDTVITTETVEVSGGETETHIAIETLNDPGTFTIDVNGETTTLTVEALETPSEPEGPEPTDPDEDGFPFYIIGVLLLVVAILGGSYYYLKKPN